MEVWKFVAGCLEVCRVTFKPTKSLKKNFCKRFESMLKEKYEALNDRTFQAIVRCRPLGSGSTVGWVVVYGHIKLIAVYEMMKEIIIYEFLLNCGYGIRLEEFL